MSVSLIKKPRLQRLLKPVSLSFITLSKDIVKTSKSQKTWQKNKVIK